MSHDLRVMFFGGSLVAGVGDPAGVGWVGRVAAECHVRGRPITAYNLGVRDETTVQLALRLAGEMLPRVRPGADCRVVIAADGDDTSVDGAGRRVPTGDSLAALERALAHAAVFRVSGFVLGPTPTGGASHDRRVKALSDDLAKTCAARGVPYIDLYKLLRAQPAWARELAAGDGVHPAGAGYDLFASTVIAGGLFDWLEDDANALSPS